MLHFIYARLQHCKATSTPKKLRPLIVTLECVRSTEYTGIAIRKNLGIYKNDGLISSVRYCIDHPPLSFRPQSSSLAQCFVEKFDNGTTNCTLPKKGTSALIPTIANKQKRLTTPRRSWIAQSLLQSIHNLGVDAQRWVEQVGHV